MSRRSRQDSDPPGAPSPASREFPRETPRDSPRDFSREPGRDDERRSRLEGVIPDLLKKAVQGGYDRASGSAESIKSFINDSKLPKEIAHAMLAQIDDTKSGVFRVVAKEVRGFLEAIDFQHEVQKLLTTVSFEIKTEIRFIPNDSQPDKLGRPDVKADMKVKRNDRGERAGKSERPPEPKRTKRGGERLRDEGSNGASEPRGSNDPNDPSDDPLDDPLDDPPDDEPEA